MSGGGSGNFEQTVLAFYNMSVASHGAPPLVAPQSPLKFHSQGEGAWQGRLG